MAILTLTVAVLALLAAGGAWVYLRRLRRDQRELRQVLHDRGLALDRRCDALQEQLDALALRQRVDRLGELVDRGRRRGVFSERTADELAEQVEALYRESSGGSAAPGPAASEV